MAETTQLTPELTDEKARIGSPSSPEKIAIDGFTEEGENLSPTNTGAEQHGLKKHSHGDDPVVPEASRGERLKSYKLADFPPLTGREEDWRFTPIKRLRGLHTDALTGSGPEVTVSGASNILVETVERTDSRFGSAAIPEDRVAAAAWEAVTQATVVTIPDETEADCDVTISINGTDEAPAAQHLIISAGKFSKAVVVLDHHGKPTLAQNIEIVVGDGAQLTVVSVQEWDDDAVHASSQQAKIGRDARFKHVVVTLGGDLVRLTPSSFFTAPGSEVEMYGLYFADAGQHLEQRLLVDHAVPNLEIETGLIEGAGHASATGRFDDEHLFYLMARGIDEKTARRLVVRGFLNEVIQQIKVPVLEERLTEAVERELAAGNY